MAQTVRICLQCRRRGFDPWVWKIPWRRAGQPTAVFLLGESPGTKGPGRLQSRGLQSHMTERLTEEWLETRVGQCCHLVGMNMQ